MPAGAGARSTSTVVLVHGAWHGAWCWERVIRELADRGVRAIAVDLPYTSWDDDISHLRSVIRAVGGPVVLIGHSLGGGAVCEVSNEPSVVALGFVTAMVVEAGESHLERMHRAGVAPEHQHAGSSELAEGVQIDVPTAGWTAFDARKAADVFFNDCSLEDQALAVAELRPMSLSSMTGVPVHSLVAQKPSYYLYCTEDRALPGDVQAAFASLVVGPHTELTTSHSPFWSEPGQLADLLATWASENHDG